MPCLEQVAVQRVCCLCSARPCAGVRGRRPAPHHSVYHSRSPIRKIRCSTQEGPGSTVQQPTGEKPGPSTTQSSSSSSSSSGTKHDVTKIDGVQPSPGSEQPWLLEKFEERRRREAAAAAAAAGDTGSLPAENATNAEGGSGTSSSTSAPNSLQHQQQQQQKAAGSEDPPKQLTPGAVLQAITQLLQLCVATAALLLWPAALAPGGLQLPRIWAMWGVYVAFFSLGSVARILRHGPLSPRSKDAQTRTWQGTAALVLFIAAMPIVHWGCVLRYCRLQPQAAGVTGCDILAGLLVPGALLLHWAASRALGRAYDRVVMPELLVTGGPYAWVQHPIYTSYMLLFAGCCLALHSVVGALAITGVCLLYYSLRCSLEQVVLLQAFGDRYASYAAATGRFLPRRTQLLHAVPPGSR